MRVDSTEELAARLREETHSLVVTADLSAHALASVRKRTEVERASFVILAFATSVVVVLSARSEGRSMGSFEDDEETVWFADVAEAPL